MPARAYSVLPIVVLGMFAFSSAAAPLISPAAGSDTVLAMREGTQGELRLQYRVERDNAPPETITIGLAKDYHYKNSGLGLWIYDYRLHRIFRTQPDNRVTNDSLYAEAWYRSTELENRAIMATALKAGGVAPGKGLASMDTYWAETDLGLVNPKFDRPDLHRTETKGRIQWSLGQEEVVAIRYRKDPVPEMIRPGLRRWWPSIVSVHPQIADEFTLTGRMPEELWVKQMVSGGKSFETAHWTLIHSEWVEAAKFPLPSGLAAAPTESRGAFPQMFATLSTLVAEQRKPSSPDAYAARIDAAITRSAGLEALVWVVEMQLAAGVQAPCTPTAPPPWCALAARAGPLAKMDPRTAVSFAAHSPDAADRPQFDNLPNAYMLRLLWATRPPGKGVKHEDAEHDLLAALQASPIANFCKDVGDFYARAWQPFAAWQAWDLGRLMAAHRSGDLLDGVDTIEADIVRRAPALF